MSECTVLFVCDQGCVCLLWELSAVLYCTVLYCTVLYCTVLYCTVLYFTVLYCIVLYYTVMPCRYGFKDVTSVQGEGLRLAEQRANQKAEGGFADGGRSPQSSLSEEERRGCRDSYASSMLLCWSSGALWTASVNCIKHAMLQHC